MKYLKLLPSLFFIVILHTACAQELNSVQYTKMYQNAKSYGDWPTAAVAIHGILAAEEDSEAWRDSLAYVYLNMNGYVACEKLCTEILEADTSNVAMLEIRAVSRRNLGKNSAAIKDYKRLVEQTKNIFHAYYLAQLQMGQDSLSAALESVQIAETLPVQETDWIQLPITQQRYQSVPLRAAVFHLKGLILQNLNATENKDHALAAYDKAIELFPDFYLAKNNRQVLAAQE